MGRYKYLSKYFFSIQDNAIYMGKRIRIDKRLSWIESNAHHSKKSQLTILQNHAIHTLVIICDLDKGMV